MAEPADLTSPVELQRRLHAEARGEPFLTLRTAEGERLFALEGSTRVTVGRGPAIDLSLEPDPEVSRLHAEIECIGGDWVLTDDGLSQNGSYVNGERVGSRRRLRDGDALRFGGTEVQFRAPGERERTETEKAEGVPTPSLSPTQQRVLVALCRPFHDGGAYAKPATNREIAAEVFLSVDAVKAHLRALFEKLGVEGYAQNEKRLRLVERAFRSGAISRHDLD